MEIEGSLQQMMKRLLAGQTEMEARAEVRQTKVDAEAKARHDHFKQDVKGNIERAINSVRSDIEQTVQKQMEALREGFRSFGTTTTIYMVASEARPKKSKACPDRMGDTVITFERSVDKIEATKMEATIRATEAAVDRLGTPSTLGCTSSRAEEADPRQSWVPAEVVYHPKGTDTPCRPCSVQGACP
jgi:hypothetical protein